MEIKFTFDETNVQVGFENQFKIKDLTDKTLVKLLMLKGEKGDNGGATKTSELINDSGFITNDDIPTKTSDLNNDSGFITKLVNNLTNYYLKSETYTKAEVNNLIGQIVSFTVQVVATLPTTDISPTTIYLVAKSGGTTGDVYDEYLYINNSWELIGNTAIDLSNYYTKAETNNLLNGKQNTLIDSGWITDTLNFGTLKYRRIGNEVYYNFYFDGNSVGAGDEYSDVFPEGYRPSTAYMKLTPYDNDGTGVPALAYGYGGTSEDNYGRPLTYDINIMYYSIRTDGSIILFEDLHPITGGIYIASGSFITDDEFV